MSGIFSAGAARCRINPPIGMSKGGTRLFGDPIQAIESDLTATVLVMSAAATTVVVIATDLGLVSPEEAGELRAAVADAMGIPSSHVLLNLSHNHSAPSFPDWMAMTDSTAESAARVRYKHEVARLLAGTALLASRDRRPARIGTGWGESRIGVYRRELRDGRDVLGEVPEHPIDSSVGVARVDDLDGNPIATLFRYSAHPVTVGPRSLVASTDYPGPAREVVERNLGGLALFLQGCGGNINPAVGIGYEFDCRDTKNRVGLELGGEVLKVAARIRTDRRPGARRTLGSVPNILFTPWVSVEGDVPATLAAVEDRVALDFVELPPPRQARDIHAFWEQTLRERTARDAPEWTVRVAAKYEHWARRLVRAAEEGPPTHSLGIQALRLDGLVIIGIDAEIFYETGLTIRQASSYPDTFVLGYTNGLLTYLPRPDDYPAGGWRVDADYAVPDMIPQAWQLPVAFAPDSEDRAVSLALDLIGRLESPSAASAE